MMWRHYLHRWCHTSRPQWVNILRPRQKEDYVVDDIFKCIFLNWIIWISIEMLFKFVSKGHGGQHFKQQWHLLRIIHWYIRLPGPLKSQPSNYWGQIDHKLWERHPGGEYNFVELWVSPHHFIKNVEIGHINNQYIIGMYLLTYMYILQIPENKVYFVFASWIAFASL